MRSELKRIQSEWGVTTIYVTHDQAEAMAISDRIAVLNQGRLMQLGPPEEIYEHPTSEFVANFIGRTNIFSGRLRHDAPSDGYGVVESEVGAIRCWFRTGAAAGTQVKFVARPENVEFELGEATGEENILTGAVAARVYLGDIAEYTIEAGGVRILARARPSQSLAHGANVRVRLPAERTIAICE
jgi:ABC-type Fe3+/spermidine/putrescine transport system ATPase subunit